MWNKYRDRVEAGSKLAGFLSGYAQDPNVVVIGLPRGGVPVAFEIARRLRKPMDVIVVRKIGVPGQPELAMGAIATGGERVLNEGVLQSCRVQTSELDVATMRESVELDRREHLYHDTHERSGIAGKTVILVDDGIATGTTMRAAIESVRKLGPEKIVLAVPVAAATTIREFRPLVDDVVCPLQPEDFFAVSMWYENFAATPDSEVCALLDKARELTSETVP